MNQGTADQRKERSPGALNFIGGNGSIVILIMNLTRREFLEKSAYGGLGLAAFSLPGSSVNADGPAPGMKPDYAKVLNGVSPAEKPYEGTVAVWFSSHYQVDPRDWNNIQEFDNDYHPLAGYYKSDDPAIVKKQLHWMRRAGIDAIVYDVYSTEKMRITDLPRDKTLPLLLQELANQQSESRKLKLIIWLEVYWGMPTPAECQFVFDYIKEHLAGCDFYFRYKGKPLVTPFLNADLDQLDEVFEKNRDDFEIRCIRPYKSDLWSYIGPYPQQKRKGWMSASPGYDAYLENAYVNRHMRHQTEPSLEKIRADAPRAAREDGLYYIKQLTWAKQCDPDIIFVSGWNDWQYGCQIEPAKEYEFFYVDLTARVLGRWAQTAPYRD
jgi:hypothetical protein